MTIRLPLVLINGEPAQLPVGDSIGGNGVVTGQEYTGSVDMQSGTTRIPYDNTSPLVTEGTELWNCTLSMTTPASQVQILFAGMLGSSATNNVITLAIFRDTTLVGFISVASLNTNNRPTSFSLITNDTPGDTLPHTYSCRIGGNNSGTWYIGRGVGSTMGGTNKLGWIVREVF